MSVSDMRKLTHLNEQGEAHRVDVGGKSSTQRDATAEATVRMHPETLELIQSGAQTKHH
jgi:cyclic pyranopterin phosphate synthase